MNVRYVRLGRKTRIPEAQRTVLWSIFERVRAELRKRKLITLAELFSSLAAVISKSKNLVFDFAVVDEAQDISVSHLRFFAALAGGGGKSPLFRLAAGRTGILTETAMNRIDAYRMVRRRAADLGMRLKIGCHTFRATGITAYLEAGGTLENAQIMAAHESPRTTKLYDRTGDEITLDEVERISI